MAEIKLTKNELRAQQNRLNQLMKYLPTLQLKKAMLQLEVAEARQEILQSQHEYENTKKMVESYSELFSQRLPIEIPSLARVSALRKRYENIAGVEVPYFEGIEFHEVKYNLFETPPWLDQAVVDLRSLAAGQAKVEIAEEKKAALEKELREVSIRVNLFEKILIPRALENIKKIKVFLGDQLLAAVSQAKVAKKKIEMHKIAFHSKEGMIDAF